MTDTTLVNDDTETSTTTQTEVKTFTQDEVNDMMAKQKSNVTRKFVKQYEDLGTVEELTAMRVEADERKQKQQIDKGEFEQTLKDLASKKDSEIQKRDDIIKGYKVNTPLIDAAAKHRSINPEQVQNLLKNQVRLNDIGDVEVVDKQNSVRYNDQGVAYDVDTLVREFLDSNPHFVQPTPTTTNTKSSHANAGNTDLDISKLDMKNPDDRAKYAEYRKTHGIA